MGKIAFCEIETASCRVWTLVVVSISYGDNHYTIIDYGQILESILTLNNILGVDMMINQNKIISIISEYLGNCNK